ncbi:MAG TPA: hypothetical protein VFQ91_14410 [Bryobacteraceae bacterium]|nr:hypothetical protein [Bryobacteraceae bacterium]
MTTGVRLFAAFLLIATLLYPQGKKSKKPKGSEAVLEKIEVRRDGDVVLLDGAVRNSGMRQIPGIVLHFEFYAPNNESLTVLNGPVEAELLDPGDETEFHLQVRYPTRAVELRVEAFDKEKRDLSLEKNGPYRID